MSGTGKPTGGRSTRPNIVSASPAGKIKKAKVPSPYREKTPALHRVENYVRHGRVVIVPEPPPTRPALPENTVPRPVLLVVAPIPQQQLVNPHQQQPLAVVMLHEEQQLQQRQIGLGMELEVSNPYEPHQFNITREPYAEEIITHLLDSQELTPLIDWRVHENISAMMRVVLVDWLIEVAHEYHLHEQTLFLCIIYLDRCLARYPVEKNRLQLLGISCLFLASKMEEVLPPPLKEFSYITDFTYDNNTILREEDKILETLDWNLSYVTVNDFITTFLAYYHLVDVDKTHFANYLSLLSLTSLDLYQNYLSSELAWAIVLLTAYTFDPSWPLENHIGVYSRYIQKQDNYVKRRACVKDLHRYVTTLQVNVHAAQQKYAKSVYGFVSNKPIPPLSF